MSWALQVHQDEKTASLITEKSLKNDLWRWEPQEEDHDITHKANNQRLEQNTNVICINRFNREERCHKVPP